MYCLIEAHSLTGLPQLEVKLGKNAHVLALVSIDWSNTAFYFLLESNDTTVTTTEPVDITMKMDTLGTNSSGLIACVVTGSLVLLLGTIAVAFNFAWLWFLPKGRKTLSMLALCNDDWFFVCRHQLLLCACSVHFRDVCVLAVSHSAVLILVVERNLIPHLMLLIIITACIHYNSWWMLAVKSPSSYRTNRSANKSDIIKVC